MLNIRLPFAAQLQPGLEVAAESPGQTDLASSKVTLVTNVYMYADETGNLDYDVDRGGSKYFGIGTATWTGDPAEHLWQGEQMRFGHAANGIECLRMPSTRCALR